MILRVLADATILFSRTLRDWLLLVHLDGGPIRVHYTEDILAETVYRLRREHPRWSGGQITRLRDGIAATLEGGRVEDFVVDGNPLPDVHDGHVHAAAVACRAHVVLTDDRDWRPDAVRGPLPYEVLGADDFFCLVDDVAPAVVRRVAVRQVEHFLRVRGAADLGEALRKAGCPRFAARGELHLDSEGG